MFLGEAVYTFSKGINVPQIQPQTMCDCTYTRGAMYSIQFPSLIQQHAGNSSREAKIAPVTCLGGVYLFAFSIADRISTSCSSGALYA